MRYFTTEEFACHCGCGFGTHKGDVDQGLLDALEELREIFSAPIHINSGCRCPDHNAAIGGVSKSQHMWGKAADIKIKGVKPEHVAQAGELIAAFFKGGIGRYFTFTHVDVRGHRARWKG